MSDPLTAAKRPMYTEADQFLQADIATVIDEIARLFDLRTDAVSTYELLRSIRGNAESQQERLRERDAELAQARAAVDTVRTFAEHEQVVEYKTLSIQETAGYQLAMRRVLHQLAQATAQPADGQQQAGG